MPQIWPITIDLAHTNAVECRRRIQRLKAEETTNLELKKRYSECWQCIDSSVSAIESGKQYMEYKNYIALTIQIIGAGSHTDQCLDTFN